MLIEGRPHDFGDDMSPALDAGHLRAAR